MDVLTRVARDMTGSDVAALQLLSSIKKSARPVRSLLPFVGRTSIIATCADQVNSCRLYLIHVIACCRSLCMCCISAYTSAHKCCVAVCACSGHGTRHANSKHSRLDINRRWSWCWQISSFIRAARKAARSCHSYTKKEAISSSQGSC